MDIKITMVKYKHSGLYFSDLLDGLSGVVHGFSGRNFGDMRFSGNRKKLLKLFKLERRRAVVLVQTHGDSIAEIASDDLSLKQLRSDGLLYNSGVQLRNIPVLCLKTADCAPVLLADPQRMIIAAVHAGWRGSLSGIAGKAVGMMISCGSKAEDIRVAIGPHIRSCCYSVPDERAEHFMDKYPEHAEIVINRKKRWYIDIGNAIINDISQRGIMDENIDKSVICTSCNSDKFYSFRKDNPNISGMNFHFISLSE